MKPTMKKWLTGLLSVALLAGNLPVYAVNTAYAAEEDGFFTDEAGSFEGSLEEPEENPDGGQSEDSFASVSGFRTACSKPGFSLRYASDGTWILVKLHLPFPVAQIFLPGFSFCSNMVTAAPFSAAAMAAISPDAPPPVTITRFFSI